MVIPREISASPYIDFDDEDRDFEPPRQPEEKQEDSQGPHERTANRNTEDPVTDPPQARYYSYSY